MAGVSGGGVQFGKLENLAGRLTEALDLVSHHMLVCFLLYLLLVPWLGFQA